MIALFNKLLDWFKALFWKEEMELTLVGLQYSGKTTFVNVIAVRGRGARARGAGRGSGLCWPAPRPGELGSPPGMAGHRRAPGGGGAGPGRLGPSTDRGGPGWRATRSSARAGMARLGAGKGDEDTGWGPGTGDSRGSRGRRDPPPAETGPLRSPRKGA